MENFGAEEVSKIIAVKAKNTETMKAVRGFWDDSKKEQRIDGFGNEIYAVERRTLDHTQNNICLVESQHCHGCSGGWRLHSVGSLGLDVQVEMNVEMMTRLFSNWYRLLDKTQT